LSKSVFSGVFLMSSSKLLEQAIVDAQALRDSAFKSAQATLLEKFAPQVKEAVEKLLEQEDPAGMAGSPEDALAADIPAGTDFGGAPPDASDKGYVAGAAKDIPLAATDGEKLCPCPDDNEDVTLELNLADLADQLMASREDKEEFGMKPMSTGLQDQPQAAGGTGLTESVELEEIELDENVEVNLDEILSEGEEEDDEEDEEDEEEESEDEEDSDEEDEDEDEDEESDDEEEEDEEDLEEAKKAKKKLTPPQMNIAKQAAPKNKITGADFKALQDKKKTNESTVKQLMSTSAQLLKEHQNTVKLVEKKDSQIQKLLEENKKFTSIIEEMSDAFKKLEEVNVLNARLFYSNQVLKSASLNERQKTHIVEAVSKADSVNEAKAVYETLINSVGGSAEKERSPKSLNEAINKKSSFRLPHKQAEQPADPGQDRWLKLAGIK
jgi:hypothetical protein